MVGVVIGVCQQNASFRQGWRMLMNLAEIYGRRAELEGGGVVLLPPRPIDVLKHPEKLLDAKLGYRARTVERVARTIVENRLPSTSAMREFDAKDVEEILRGIKGVGAYTARLAMVLALRRYELVPMDRWLAALVAEAYGVDSRRAEEEWSARWGSWSGLASMALTVALDAAPLREALRRVKEGRVLPEGGLGPATLWRYSDL